MREEYVDGKFEKLHLPMVFPALLCGIYGLSDWMQIKWMGKFNTLKLKSAFEFPEGTSQPQAGGGELQAAGLGQPWLRGAGRICCSILLLQAGKVTVCTGTFPAASQTELLLGAHRCHMKFYIYPKPSSEKLCSF